MSADKYRPGIEAAARVLVATQNWRRAGGTKDEPRVSWHLFLDIEAFGRWSAIVYGGTWAIRDRDSDEKLCEGVFQKTREGKRLAANALVRAIAARLTMRAQSMDSALRAALAKEGPTHGA